MGGTSDVGDIHKDFVDDGLLVVKAQDRH